MIEKSNVDSISLAGNSSKINTYFSFCSKKQLTIFKLIEKAFNKKELEYIKDIYFNLLEEEKLLMKKLRFNYMQLQPDINSEMRAILIDWLISVHLKFRLKPETLYQTVYLIDAYLSNSYIKRNELQLLGITALFIAAKFNEIYYPKIDEFVNITDNAYKKSDVLSMEINIFKVLTFDIFLPNHLDFFNIISKCFSFDDVTHNLGLYFMESSLLNDLLIQYPPSVIALACAYIVMKFFNIKNYHLLYSNNMLKHECPQKIIKEVARQICHLVKFLTGSSYTAIKDKYASEYYKKVSLICESK